jgi:hypothetical protein
MSQRIPHVQLLYANIFFFKKVEVELAFDSIVILLVLYGKYRLILKTFISFMSGS